MTQHVSILGISRLSAVLVRPSAGRSLALASAGSMLISAAAQISVPLMPVPMTLQTYAVLLLGATLGWRIAGLSALLYLIEAALGLPVLANGTSGLLRLIGPTGGYLLAFPIAAMAVGLAVQRSGGINRLWVFFVMMAAHAVILAMGTTWLATALGWEKAVAVGTTPFLLGSVVKSALVVASVEALASVRQRLRK
ncbi:biotin transporter BioY [Boseaceae bacterium BT-24-1]|nr:biotin transporter BioY [Boseaceae bacterium BT-24-1]